MHIESAGLAEICRAGYGGLVDLFKQFDTHTKRAEYLPLKSGSDTMAFFSGILSATPILFCNIRNFHDERLYYAALDGSSVWRFPEDVHSRYGPCRAMALASCLRLCSPSSRAILSTMFSASGNT